MKRILVTGAGGPAGINFVKSIQLAPERIFIVGTEANEYFIHLATTDKKYHVPKAIEHGYIDSLNAILKKERVEFLHAQPDVEVEVISENREKLESNVFLPSKQAVRACQDKLEAAKLWKKNGVPVANVMELRKESDVDAAFEECEAGISACL